MGQTFNQTCIELEEDGVRIALTIVDTPGFGDNIDNEFTYVTTAVSSLHLN
jgi:septin family protein